MRFFSMPQLVSTLCSFQFYPFFSNDNRMKCAQLGTSTEPPLYIKCLWTPSQPSSAVPTF